jgi:hypothetical protein
MTSISNIKQLYFDLRYVKIRYRLIRSIPLSKITLQPHKGYATDSFMKNHLTLIAIIII